jgi:hypothetical protein
VSGPEQQDERCRLELLVEGRHPSLGTVARHFRFGHLQKTLRWVSEACHDLACKMVEACPSDDPELTVGLRKLLEAKDAFVRSRVFYVYPDPPA